MRSRAIETGTDRLETAALRYALVREGQAAPVDAPEVTHALEELAASALELLNLHKQETVPSCSLQTFASSRHK